ncbi:unnamed protein product [Didymodactylos carnosus]|uniref:Uncharacterized protein n=1 Tax=Didymodactylos carnosus TaxID=1234261 RepID=A0A814SW67_9BILA|nr:unnamed protein product [Didymodactylos carnosus]CAF1149984.1 unnamed protein product [Didymodactylos carnosus]CAF3567875.1 unnamed protein product [Didymodactylos carnosus]CAF3913555.1 unnamed protein product [Didymodactylos carnosus]
MAIVAYCKTAAQILDDATHVVYYKFDTTPGLTADSGPLYINGTSNGVSLASSPSKANQSLYFPSGTNYYQFQGLTYFSTSGWPYSISLWIYPLSQSGGTIVHASGGYGTNGVGNTGWCLPMLGFSSSGVLYAQSTSSTSTLIVLTGPTVALNSWTYVAITYSSTNGLRLYINSVLQTSSTAAFTFISSGSPNTITLGNGLTGATSSYCPQGSITSAQYQGYIDSFNLYSRELTTSYISTLYTTPQP